jgi:hypothetical protein
VIRASCDYGDFNQKPALLKVDTTGNILWTRTFQGKESFQGTQRFYQTEDQGFFIPTTINIDAVKHFGILKTDSLGMLACNENLITFTKEPADVFVTDFDMTDSAITFTRSIGFESEPILFSDSILCCDSVNASFSYEAQGDGTFLFSADIMEGASYSWTFGEVTYEGQEVIYEFPSNGEVEVCLHVSNYCNADSICENVSILGITGDKNEIFQVYPNPFNETLIITDQNSTEGFICAIFNYAGQQVYASDEVTHEIVLNSVDFPNGVYMIRLVTKKGKVYMNKVVKL